MALLTKKTKSDGDAAAPKAKAPKDKPDKTKKGRGKGKGNKAPKESRKDRRAKVQSERSGKVAAPRKGRGRNAGEIITIPRAAFAPPGKGIRVGVELDGNTVRAVTISNGSVTGWREYHGANAAEAIAKFYDDGLKGSTQIAWGGHGIWIRPADLPPVPTNLFHIAATNAATKVMPVDANSSNPVLAAAALIGDEESNAMLAAGRGDIARAVRDTVGRRIPVSPAAFLLGADGPYLALRGSGVEMMLVVDGMIAAYRSLPVAKLQDICIRHEVAEIKYLPYSDDPDAVRSTYQWIADVAMEAADTLGQWQRSGFPITNEVWVFGPGAVLTGLAERLADQSIEPRPAPLPASVDLGVLAAGEWLTAYQALVAAMAEPSGLLRFTDPAALEESAEAQKRSQKRVRLYAGVVVSAALVAGLAIPWQQAQSERNSANSTLQRAEQELAALAEVVAQQQTLQRGETAIQNLEETSVPINDIVNLLLNSMPAGATWSDLTVGLAEDGENFSVSGNLNYGGPEGLAAVLRTFELLGVNGIAPNNLIGAESAQFTFVLPRVTVFPEEAVVDDTGADPIDTPAPGPVPAPDPGPTPTVPVDGDLTDDLAPPSTDPAPEDPAPDADPPAPEDPAPQPEDAPDPAPAPEPPAPPADAPAPDTEG